MTLVIYMFSLILLCLPSDTFVLQKCRPPRQNPKPHSKCASTCLIFSMLAFIPLSKRRRPLRISKIVKPEIKVTSIYMCIYIYYYIVLAKKEDNFDHTLDALKRHIEAFWFISLIAEWRAWAIKIWWTCHRICVWHTSKM